MLRSSDHQSPKATSKPAERTSYDYVKLQTVSQLAASADSSKTGIQESRGAQQLARRLCCGLPGGCASRRLDHGLQFPVIRGGCASSRPDHGWKFASNHQHLHVTAVKKAKPRQGCGCSDSPCTKTLSIPEGLRRWARCIRQAKSNKINISQ